MATSRNSYVEKITLEKAEEVVEKYCKFLKGVGRL